MKYFDFSSALRSWIGPTINLKPRYCDFCGRYLERGYVHSHRGNAVEVLTVEESARRWEEIRKS